jgi:surface antigen
MTMILVGLGTGGCSFFRDSGPLAKVDDGDLTGALAGRAQDAAPTETDLAFARNAASDVLSKGDKDSSQHWENPQTGARGSVTPIAQAYAAEDGRRCRDFLVSYVNGRTESWLQGAGCQAGRGHWEIHTLKPWRS